MKCDLQGKEDELHPSQSNSYRPVYIYLHIYILHTKNTIDFYSAIYITHTCYYSHVTRVITATLHVFTVQFTIICNTCSNIIKDTC